MFRKLREWFTGTTSSEAHQPAEELATKPEEQALTLDEIKNRILTMNSGEKKSFPIDNMPEDQDFDNLSGWIVINKGAAFIGRDYKHMRLDIALF